ncbi:MAG TPA: FtsX-like permease family protein [Thermoleophilaceae bacterium]
MRLPGGPLASLRRLRARPGRSFVAALGIAAAAAMLGSAVTVGYGLHTGFDRAARAADLPDVIAHFDDQRLPRVDERLRALPNLRARAYRQEFTGVPMGANGHRSDSGAVEVLDSGPHGYAIVAGRDVRGPNETVVERGVAREWHIRVGQRMDVGRGQLRVVGIGVSPDNVAFPLAKAPRIYVEARGLGAGFASRPRANVALVWLNDPGQLEPTLTQARAASFRLSGLRFLTRSGVRTTIDQAAGIVIALLVAFSLIALASAGVMLAASASADVQRRLQAIGVVRALGFTPRSVAAQYALDAAVLALPAGAAGVLVGTLVSYGPSARLLESLNELAPGGALAGPLALAVLAVVLLVAASSVLPAWRAARRPVVDVLRSADLPRRTSGSRLPAGFLGLGMRLAAARRGRMLATVCVLGLSAGVVLSMLSIASLLSRLQHDPGIVGKRYQLTVDLPASRAREVARLPGVAAAAPRYVVFAADSFELGESLKVVAYPGDHTPFEDPPLAAGRRLRSDGEAEVGTGIADGLGVQPGAELAIELPTGREVRFRVVGLVRAFDDDGRVIYTRPRRLLAADPSLGGPIAVRLAAGADRASVVRSLERIGANPQPVAAATTRNTGFLGVLAALLRVVAIVDGVVCLYILVQALALTARERRSTIAVLRASGAGAREVRLVLLGASLVAVLGAAPTAVALELLVFGPAASRLAAGYVSLPLGAGLGEIAIVVGGLLVLGAAAAALAARQLRREPVVSGLRGD